MNNNINQSELISQSSLTIQKAINNNSTSSLLYTANKSNLSLKLERLKQFTVSIFVESMDESTSHSQNSDSSSSDDGALSPQKPHQRKTGSKSMDFLDSIKKNDVAVNGFSSNQSFDSGNLGSKLNNNSQSMINRLLNASSLNEFELNELELRSNRLSSLTKTSPMVSSFFKDICVQNNGSANRLNNDDDVFIFDSNPNNNFSNLASETDETVDGSGSCNNIAGKMLLASKPPPMPNSSTHSNASTTTISNVTHSNLIILNSNASNNSNNCLSTITECSNETFETCSNQSSNKNTNTQRNNSSNSEHGDRQMPSSKNGLTYTNLDEYVMNREELMMWNSGISQNYRSTLVNKDIIEVSLCDFID